MGCDSRPTRWPALRFTITTNGGRRCRTAARAVEPANRAHIARNLFVLVTGHSGLP